MGTVITVITLTLVTITIFAVMCLGSKSKPLKAGSWWYNLYQRWHNFWTKVDAVKLPEQPEPKDSEDVCLTDENEPLQ